MRLLASKTSDSRRPSSKTLRNILFRLSSSSSLSVACLLALGRAAVGSAAAMHKCSTRLRQVVVIIVLGDILWMVAGCCVG